LAEFSIGKRIFDVIVPRQTFADKEVANKVFSGSTIVDDISDYFKAELYLIIGEDVVGDNKRTSCTLVAYDMIKRKVYIL